MRNAAVQAITPRMGLPGSVRGNGQTSRNMSVTDGGWSMKKRNWDVEEMTEIEVDPGTLVETETAPVENLPLPFWRRRIHYGLTDQCKSAAAFTGNGLVFGSCGGWRVKKTKR